MRNTLVTAILVYALVISENSYSGPLPIQCRQDCAVEFGRVVGESASGVRAYSNCNNTCVHPEPYFVSQIFTGIKWQCVEYARRWLLKNEGVVYGDVDIAADIWSIEFVHSSDKQQHYDFMGIVNGSDGSFLQRGDLLIYSREFYGTGHVAVVLRVDLEKQLVYVGEQNFKNKNWDKNYARAIPYIMRNNATWLLDSYIVGWKRIKL